MGWMHEGAEVTARSATVYRTEGRTRRTRVFRVSCVAVASSNPNKRRVEVSEIHSSTSPFAHCHSRHMVVARGAAVSGTDAS